MKKLFILGLLALSVSGMQVVSACEGISDGPRAVVLDVDAETQSGPTGESD